MDARPRRIGFDTRKYGPHLCVDAAAIESLPGFITSPVLHQLTFFEIALIQGGDGALELDGEPLRVGPCRLIVTAPGESRSWRLQDPDDLRGRLAFFEEAFVEDLAGGPAREAFPILCSGRLQRAFDVDPPRFERLSAIVDAMRAEVAGLRADSVHALRARLYQLLVEIQRLSGADAACESGRASAHVRRFRALVEARFVRHSPVAEYANALKISARHLNECVRRGTGRTASELIHERVALEARRMLLHSTLSVGQIAEALGFADTSYFTRFFRRLAGTTPAQFRRDRMRTSFARKSD